MATNETEAISESIEALQEASTELTTFFEDKLEGFKSRESDREMKYEEEKAVLENELEEVKAELALKEGELENDRSSFENEKVSLQGTHKFSKQKIKLDIGGRRFTTSLTTLKSEPDSFLSAMLSGRYELAADQNDGSYFIDRDGNEFHHILNFLRGPEQFEVPSDRKVLQVLKEDAIYYRMPGFQKIIEEAIAVR